MTSSEANCKHIQDLGKNNVVFLSQLSKNIKYILMVMHIYCLNQYDLQIELSKFILGKILD